MLFSILSGNPFGLSDETKWIAENIVSLVLSLFAVLISIGSILLTVKYNKMVKESNNKSDSANKIANEALTLSKDESKIRRNPFLHIKSILLIKSNKDNLSRSHYRLIGRMNDKNIKSLDHAIHYEKIDDEICKDMIIKQNSVYLTKFKNQKCIIFNFLNNSKYDEITDIVVEHQVNIIKLVNYGIPIVRIYANFAYIYYNEEEQRGKEIYLKGDKCTGIDVDGEDIFEIALDEVTMCLIDSICTIDSNIYSVIDPEIELLYSSIREVNIKYRKLVISLTLMDVAHREHYVILILDTSTGRLNVNGFIEVKKEVIENVIGKVEKDHVDKKVRNIPEDIFMELLADYNRI